MNQITIVVPCFNEEEVLRQFHQRVNEVLSAIEDCSFRLLLSMMAVGIARCR